MFRQNLARSLKYIYMPKALRTKMQTYIIILLYYCCDLIDMGWHYLPPQAGLLFDALHQESEMMSKVEVSFVLGSEHIHVRIGKAYTRFEVVLYYDWGNVWNTGKR